MSYTQKYCKPCGENRRAYVKNISQGEKIWLAILGFPFPPLWGFLAYRLYTQPATCDTCGSAKVEAPH